MKKSFHKAWEKPEYVEVYKIPKPRLSIVKTISLAQQEKERCCNPQNDRGDNSHSAGVYHNPSILNFRQVW